MHNRIKRGIFGIAGKLELFNSLQEKRALFLVIQGIAEIDIHLPGICLHLAKIRVVSGIQHQARGKPQLPGQAEIRLPVFFRPLSSFVSTAAGMGQGRQHLNHPLVLHIPHQDRLGLGQDRAFIRENLREADILRCAHYIPDQPNSHPDLFFNRKTDAFKGNFDFHSVTLIIDGSLAVPDHIVAAVQVTGGIQDTIPLDSQGIDQESVCGLEIAEGIDTNGHPVIPAHVVPVGHSRFNPGDIFLKTAGGKVKILPVGTGIHHCFFTGRLSIIGFKGFKVLETRGNGPYRVIQLPVQYRRGIDKWNCNRCAFPGCKAAHAGSEKKNDD